MQIYGIDLAKEKFDVSFFDLTSKKVSNYYCPLNIQT